MLSLPSKEKVVVVDEDEKTTYTRHPRPMPKRKMRLDIVMEGWLKKQASSGLFKAWQSRYFVLYANSREIRYYGGVAESIFGNVPIDERGSIPLEFIVDIKVPEVDAHGGRRFDVHTSKVGDHSYPRDSQGVAAGSRAVHARIYSFEALSIHDRQEWVRHLRAMTGIGAHGGRSRSMFIPDAATDQPEPTGATPRGRAMYSFSPSAEDVHARPTITSAASSVARERSRSEEKDS